MHNDHAADQRICMHTIVWRWLKWLSLLVAAGSVAVAVFMVTTAGPGKPSDDKGSSKPNTEVDQPVLVERKDGRIIWQLRASEANQQLDGQMHLIKPMLRLYTESGKEVLINGDQAWFSPVGRDIKFQDHVTVVYEQWTMTSKTLIYDSTRDQINVPDPFEIHGDSITAKGKDMTLKRQSEEIEVSQGIWIRDTDPQWQGVTP